MNESGRTGEKNGMFLCFVGPAGAGKSFLSTTLLERYPEDLELAVSATTRTPRPGEVDGQHYFFLSREEFQEKVEQEEFFEWEETHGNLYGTPQRWVDLVRNGQQVLLDIDIRGMRNFSENFPEQVCGVLVLPPGVEELITRIRERGGVGDDELRIRLQTAKRELGDFFGAVEDSVIQHLIVNSDQARALQEAEALLFHREEGRPQSDRETLLRELHRFSTDLERTEI